MLAGRQDSSRRRIRRLAPGSAATRAPSGAGSFRDWHDPVPPPARDVASGRDCLIVLNLLLGDRAAKDLEMAPGRSYALLACPVFGRAGSVFDAIFEATAAQARGQENRR